MTVSERHSVSPLVTQESGLEECESALARMIAPNEGIFLTLGNVLGDAKSRLGDGAGSFRRLFDMLDSRDGSETMSGLTAVQGDILRLITETQAITSTVVQLEKAVSDINRPLGSLAKIIVEIAALATNAKVQTAQINSQAIDFTVFTKDIGRLQGLAGEAVGRAGDRLQQLGAALSEARLSADSFQRKDAAQLGAIGGRLEGRIRELTSRQARIREAISGFEARMGEIARRISECITALQINDITGQRIEHVRSALSMLRRLALVNGTGLSGEEWMRDLPEEQRHRLLGAVCRLQSQQVERASADFSAEFGRLRGNLAGLSADAGAILAEAQRLFGGTGSQGSFVQDIEADVGAASRLLENFCTTDDHLRKLILGVASGFKAMSEEMDAIHSIDADMRIMGLNATLKCARLGDSGRALGVVAQELRACSRRTEENSQAIYDAIQTSSTVAENLADRSGREHEAASGLTLRLGQLDGELKGLEGALTDILATLQTSCGEAAIRLGSAASEAALESRWDEEAARVARRLVAIADGLGVGEIDPDLVRDDIHRLLGTQYTMSSERIIHQLFAREGEEPVGSAASPTEANQNLDDIFF